MWRGPEADDAEGDEFKLRPRCVTVSYNEAGRLLDGGEQVDAVPMPPEILAWMEPFVAEHYQARTQAQVAPQRALRSAIAPTAA